MAAKVLLSRGKIKAQEVPRWANIMKPAKMRDKIIERKIIQVFRTLPEFIVKPFFLLLEVCTFKIKIRNLPEDGAALVFHLVSARTVTPLCSVKGLNKTNSIENFPKLHTTKEKLSAVSQPTSSSPSSCREPIPCPFLAALAWPQWGHRCTKVQAHTKGRCCFFHAKVTTLLRFYRYWEVKCCSKEPRGHEELKGKEKDSVDKHRFNKFQYVLTLLCAKESKSEKALVLLNNCVSYLGVNISSFIYIQRSPHLLSFLEDRADSLDGNFNWTCSGCCTRTLMCRPVAGKKRLSLTTYTLTSLQISCCFSQLSSKFDTCNMSRGRNCEAATQIPVEFSMLIAVSQSHSTWGWYTSWNTWMTNCSFLHVSMCISQHICIILHTQMHTQWLEMKSCYAC